MTRRLSALDLAFLALETQRTPVNVAALQILKAPKGYEGNFVRDLLDRLMQQPPGPPFNLKLSTTNLARLPRWVEDDHFDLSYHVRHSALPKPGTMSDLLDLAARLHSRVMDRGRPLWELHVIEGLPGRRFAVYMKMHHAAIDGMGGVAILESCFSEDPEAEVRAPWNGVRARKSGGRRFADLAELPASLTRSATRQLQMGRDLGRLLLGHGMKSLGLRPAHSPVPFAAPKTLFNVPVSGARRIVVRTLSLSQIKTLGRAAGASVNDIILAICGGALREYLRSKRALPRRTLVASVPVSIRQINRSGNRITYVGAKLATQRRDPLRRLQEISESTLQAKQEVADVTPSAAITFAVMAQGLVAVLNRLRLTDWMPPPANVIISNVPGPRKPLYLGGAKMLSNFPLSVLVDGQALNITVISYCDSVDFGLMACRDTLPDVEAIGDYITQAFDELKTALEKRSSVRSTGGAKAKPRATARKRKSKRRVSGTAA